jgi:hypothetical protein
MLERKANGADDDNMLQIPRGQGNMNRLLNESINEVLNPNLKIGKQLDNANNTSIMDLMGGGGQGRGAGDRSALLNTSQIGDMKRGQILNKSVLRGIDRKQNMEKSFISSALISDSDSGNGDEILKLDSCSSDSNTEIKNEEELNKPSGLGFREMFKL